MKRLRTRGVVMLVVFGVALALIGVFFSQEEVRIARDGPVLVPPPPEVKPWAIEKLLEPGAIQAVDEPQFVGAEEAAGFMRPGERVVGLRINGDARAYPITILSVHEIVNDVVGGEPVAITWCPLCFTALVYSRRVQGEDETLSFGVSGSLLYETLVMVDRGSGSLWSQLYGAAVDGPLTGARLSYFASVLTEWTAWAAEHPDSLVLSKELTCAQFHCDLLLEEPALAYQTDIYEGYYANRDLGVINKDIPRGLDEEEIPAKERTLGVRAGGITKAYPFANLRRQGVINDTLDKLPVVIWFDPDIETGAAFVRQVDQEPLTFQAVPGDPSLLVDAETSSLWQGSSGRAIDGPLKGAQLPAIVTTTAFEFGWYDYFPDSQTYK